MLFHSVQFFIFLVIVFAVYWYILGKDYKKQNILLILASYVFYGFWDWRFLILIFISSLGDYIIGKQIYTANKQKNKRLLLIASLTINLGLLAFFKYFNFFIESFTDLANLFGFKANYHSLKIILPVGISFYTFQTLSYTLDIYNKKLVPTKSLVSFLAFVSFFPQLVAGPIERASNLLPQFNSKRIFNSKLATEGLRRILWGLFLKVVIADQCAETANLIFGQHDSLNGNALFLGALCFSFQIYGDFCGYSEIAIGTARLFGFDLMRNFKFPYFSVNIVDFWRRWHISLSTWFRDYVYIPLGGSRAGAVRHIINILITFTISGLWHGANWTFVAWGFLHALYYAVYFVLQLLTRNNKTTAVRREPKLRDFYKIIPNFLVVLLLWVFFRAENISQAFQIIAEILSPSLFVEHKINDSVLFVIGLLIVIEWVQRKKEYVLDIIKLPMWLRWGIYLVLSVLVFNNWGREIEFIYFQF